MERNQRNCLWKAFLLLAVGCLLFLGQALNSLRTVTAQEEDNVIHLPLIRRDQAIGGHIYFLSPQGNDTNSGKTESQAWATFDRALNKRTPGEDKLGPGDTLILMDGVYYQSLHPHGVSGEPGQPIMIRAQHDGQAIIDGRAMVIPVWMEKYRSANYYVIEGIVARNSSGNVFAITADHNMFRRVSGYNAHTDRNSKVFAISANHILLEDCIASGTGRKMILVYQGQHNTIRRCFADWREWDGREWSSCWPWGEGLEFYGASHNIIENSIAFGHVPRAGVSLLAQASQASNGNQILGTMSIMAGIDEDGERMVWGNTRPQPTEYTCVQNFDNWPSLLSGFRVGGSGEIQDNLLQDIFAWGNARLGLTFHRPGDPLHRNNRVNRATVLHNGFYNREEEGGAGADAQQEELLLFDSVENSFIEDVWLGGSVDNRTTMHGEGARLTHRYVDGVLMDGTNGQLAQPLWPWPMENRIQAELGISVTEMMTEIIFGTSD